MDTSRNRFSNVICVLFSATLALLVCFSIGIRFGIDNMVSRAIIAAVYCGIVVGLAFALNKVVNKANKSKYIDEDRLFTIAVVVDAVLFLVLRLLVISDILKVDFKLSTVFEMAKIGANGKMFIGFSNLDAIFATVLSCMFKLFGNTFFPVYLIQFVLSAISFALIIISVNKIFGKCSSFVTGLGFASLPFFVKSIASDSADNLIILLLAIVLILTAKYKDIIERDNINIALSLLLGVCTGIFSLYSGLLMLAIIIPIVVLWDCRSEYVKDRVINTVVMVLGNVITFGIALLVDSYLISGTGVEGFVSELLKHINYRFGFATDFSLLRWGLDDTGLFFVMILSIIYCVIYWKNDEDSAHIPSLFVIVFVLQLVFIGANNHSASMMILSIALLIIGGHGLSGLGYDNSYSGVYRIDDDMQPAVIESIGDKKIDSKAQDMNIVEETKTQTDEKNSSEVEESLVENNVAEEEIEVIEEEKSQEEIKVVEEEKAQEEVKVVEEEKAQEEIKVVEEEKPQEENNNVEEENIDSSYGINNADFESLFNVSSVPPKFVYNDIYTVEEVVDSDDESSESLEEINEQNIDEEDTTANTPDAIENDLKNEEDDAIKEDKAKDDAKAYVDSFFGYLYNDGNAEFEAFEPLKPLDDMPIIEDKEEQQEYVSHADKFADLDIDLGVDAFDNVVINESDITTKQEGDEDEFFFDDVTVENETITEWEPISVETFEDNEESIEAMLEEKINQDFSYEEALNRKIDNEEIEKEIGFSYEQAIEKKLEVEEAISNAIAKDAFSYEEAYRNKILAEEVVIEAVDDDNISVVSSIESKLDIEDDIENNASENGFSYQEALETKLDVEKMIENATNDKILEEFKSEELLEGVVFDFGENSSTEIIEEDRSDFTEETKTEVETGFVEETRTEAQFDSVEETKTEAETQNAIEEIQFIENPLPLPKKHVHREMDYGRVIPSAWMHFDVELDNKNNHYDI